MKKIVSLMMTAIMLIAIPFSFCADENEQTRLGVYSSYSATPYNYTSFNCYGYAIGTNQNIDPGYYCSYGVSYSNMTWNQFKSAVKQDLAALGYTSIQEVTSTYYLQTGEKMIAAVSGWWTAYNLYSPSATEQDEATRYEGKNYHFFVKNTNGGGWFHKFGTLSVTMKLKSNYTPSSITITDEYFTSSTNYVPASCYYSGSNIVYIKYQTGVPITLREGEG